MQPSLTDRILQWIEGWLDELFLQLAGTGTGTIIAWTVILIAAGVALFFGIRFLRRMQRSPELAQPFDGEVGRSPRDWAAEAGEHESAGRLSEAIRCHYRALIADLAAAGELEEVPGRTAREYLMIARHRQRPWLEPLERATRIFEPAWYSGQTVDPADVEAIKQARNDAGSHATRRPAGAAQ